MTWQSDKLKEAHKELVDRVIKDMEEGKVFFWDSEHLGHSPRNIDSQRVNGRETKLYHGKNKFILSFVSIVKGYKDSRWGTYNAIAAAGGQVRKGEKATMVEVWVWDKPVKHKNPKTGKWETVYQKDDRGNFLLDKNGRKMPKMKHLDTPIVKGYPVFNAEQADGLEPEHRATISESDRQVKMEAIISGSEAVIYNDQVDSNYYNPVRDEIHVMRGEDFKTMSGYYATVPHEIAHSTGAESRLNRECLTKGEGFGSVSYAKEELVAEMTSMFLAQDYDIKFDESHYENHAAYLQNWVSVLKDNPDELYKAAEQAEKAVTYIKEHMLEKGKALDYKESKAQVQAVAEETEEYKYYMDMRPVSPGAVPKGFIRFDEDDFGGRYGAIYYRGKLTDKQVADYELIPAWERDKTMCNAELAGGRNTSIAPKEKLLKELEKSPFKGLAKGA